jgi:hypothetical protein
MGWTRVKNFNFSMGWTRVKNFNFSISSSPALRSAHPPIEWLLWAISVGLKWKGLETDHSPPTNVEVKETRIYTSTPPYAFMV